MKNSENDVRRQQHITCIQRAIARGEREIKQVFDGQDIGDCVAIECYSERYHELVRKQTARTEMLTRLTRT